LARRSKERRRLRRAAAQLGEVLARRSKERRR
jgi:hypothetical protein